LGAKHVVQPGETLSQWEKGSGHYSQSWILYTAKHQTKQAKHQIEKSTGGCDLEANNHTADRV
jgi:hypothetical protein